MTPPRILLLGIILCSCPLYAAESPKGVPALPLLARWPLDENASELAYDMAGAHTGLLQGNAQWDSGVKEGAIALDGEGGYIKTEPVLNPSTGPFSFSVWVQGSSVDQVIGASAGLGQAWQGRIDDVRIYGTALTAGQVEALAQTDL